MKQVSLNKDIVHENELYFQYIFLFNILPLYFRRPLC